MKVPLTRPKFKKATASSGSPSASEVAEEVADTFRRNWGFVLLATLCLLDGALVIAGLSTKSPWLFQQALQTDGTSKAVLNWLGVSHVVGWAIGPPCWFFLETAFIQAKLLPTAANLESNARKAGLERLKIMQDLGAKVWAAVLVAILFLVPK